MKSLPNVLITDRSVLGVDVRLADYGVSQFSTPSGLWRHRGTEEYMAPELRGSDNLAYDEKVTRGSGWGVGP